MYKESDSLMSKLSFYEDFALDALLFFFGCECRLGCFDPVGRSKGNSSTISFSSSLSKEVYSLICIFNFLMFFWFYFLSSTGMFLVYSFSSLFKFRFNFKDLFISSCFLLFYYSSSRFYSSIMVQVSSGTIVPFWLVLPILYVDIWILILEEGSPSMF